MKNIEDFEALSPLEADVLKILWPSRSMTVRKIYDRLRGKRDVALTSIAVILDRLYKRGLVDRSMEAAKGGIRYIYFPKKDKKQFEQTVVQDAVDRLIEKFGPTATNYFNERFGRK
jgi:predicted transcriptional regulator